MRFRLFGIGVRISLPFTAVLCAMLLLDKTGLLPAAFFAALIHECSHLLAMLACKAKPDSIRFCVCAVEIIRSHRPIPRRCEVLISLAGPAANLLLGGLLLLFGQFNHAAVQLTMGCFNLLPVMGLDGGTVVELLTGSRRAVVLTSALTVGLMTWYLFCGGGPASPGFLCSMLYICAMRLICAGIGNQTARL